jgi:hypothetical protein
MRLIRGNRTRRLQFAALAFPMPRIAWQQLRIELPQLQIELR